jgi:hypothetical protein
MLLHTDKAYNYMPLLINDECTLDRIKRFHFDPKLKERGESGLVYVSKTHNVVLKVSPIDVPNFFDLCDVKHYKNDICSTIVTKRSFNREMRIARKAASIHVGPKFYDTFYTTAESEAHEQVFGTTYDNGGPHDNGTIRYDFTKFMPNVMLLIHPFLTNWNDYLINCIITKLWYGITIAIIL